MSSRVEIGRQVAGNVCEIQTFADSTAAQEQSFLMVPQPSQNPQGPQLIGWPLITRWILQRQAPQPVPASVRRLIASTEFTQSCSTMDLISDSRT